MIIMDERIKNFGKFFHDQMRLSEVGYKSTFSTSIAQLYAREEITFGYVSKINENGFVEIRFPRNHAPRLKVLKNITLVTRTARQTYGNSVKDWDVTLEQFCSNGANHTSYSDLVPQYYVKDNTGYDVVACGRITLKMFNLIQNSLQRGKELTAIVFDPFPPVDYYLNMENYLEHHGDENELYLEPKITYDEWEPEELSYDPKNEFGIADRVYNGLENEGCVILQGPPGTGKSYTIANIISRYLDQGKSVCATTMANKGLIELVKQSPLKKYLIEGKVSKTNLSADEKKEARGLKEAVVPLVVPEGELLLATNYVLSGVYSKANESQVLPSYDLVVIEEASQAFLATIVGFKALGKKCLIVGDPMQLPPIVQNANSSSYLQWRVDLQTNGLETFALGTNTKAFRIMTTFRLTPASAKLTSVFYGTNFRSVQREKDRPNLSGINNPFVPVDGGGVYCYTDDFTNGIYSETAINIMRTIIHSIHEKDPDLEIAIITPFKDAVIHIQKEFLTASHINTLTIETIDRIQGMTVDYTILYIPGRNVTFAFNLSRFNVATSRSKSATLILSDVPLENFHTIDNRIKNYIERCVRISPEGKIQKFESKEVAPKPCAIPSTGNLHIFGKIDLSKFEKPKKEIRADKKNIYVIDTNVFVNCPDVISRIDKKYEVVLSAKVIDELDHLKIKLDANGVRNVQKALQSINREMGVREIKMELSDLSLLPKDFDRRSPDNNILTVLLKYKGDNPILLTSDNGLQIKAKGLGLTVISLKEFLRERKY